MELAIQKLAQKMADLQGIHLNDMKFLMFHILGTLWIVDVI
jgi:hypothetical protein